jgi:hypothetical protein
MEVISMLVTYIIVGALVSAGLLIIAWAIGQITEHNATARKIVKLDNEYQFTKEGKLFSQVTITL